MTDLLNKIKFTRLPEYFQKAVGFETYNRLQYFKEYQDLLDFTEADNLEFAARKPKAPKIGKKITQKGGRVITCDPSKTYPCGNVCRGQDKPCKNPIEGQAKTYAEFLKIQSKQSKTRLDKSDKTLDTGKDKPVKQGETGMSSWDRKQEKVQEFAKTTLEAIQKTSEFKELKNLMSGYKNRDGSLKNSDPEWVLRFPHFDVNNDKVGKRVNELQKQLQSKFNLHPIGDSNSFNRFKWEKTFDSSTEVKGTQGVIPKPDTATTKPEKETPSITERDFYTQKLNELDNINKTQSKTWFNRKLNDHLKGIQQEIVADANGFVTGKDQSGKPLTDKERQAYGQRIDSALKQLSTLKDRFSKDIDPDVVTSSYLLDKGGQSVNEYLQERYPERKRLPKFEADTTTTKPEKEVATTAAKETKPRNTNLITDKGEKIPLSPQEIKVLTGRDKLSASDKTILSKNPSIVMLSKRIAETGDDKLMRKWEGRALVPGKGIDSSIAKEMLKDIDDFEAGKGKTATAAKETKPAAITSGEERSRSAKKQKVTKVGSYELTDDDIALLPWRTKQLLDTKSGRDELGKNKELLNLVKEISSSGDQELIDKYKKSGVNKSTFNDTYSKVRDDIYASKRKRGIETDIDRQIRQAKELEELERQDDLKRKNAAKQAKEESIKRAKASGAAPLDKDNLEKGESLSSTQSKKEFLEQYRDNYVKTANATDYDTEKADKTLLEVIDSDKTASEIAKLKNKIAVDKDLKERGFKASGSGTEGRLSIQVLKETKAKLKSLEDRQNKVDDFILKGGFHQGLPPFMSETPSDAWSGFVPPSPKAMQKAYDLAQQRRDQLVKNQSKTKSKSFTEPNTPFVWDRKAIAFYRDYPLNKTPSLINR